MIEDGIALTIQQKRVTYDLERMMPGATKLKSSEYASAIIENMQAAVAHARIERVMRRTLAQSSSGSFELSESAPEDAIQGDLRRNVAKKVTVVGGGFVGSTTAQRIHDAGLADVVLTDILEGVPGRQSAGHGGIRADPRAPTRTPPEFPRPAGDYSGTANSDIIVITAGFPRKPGMSRDDLLKANYDVIKAVVEAIVKLSPNAILIVVTNPLDAMAQAASKSADFPKSRVIGMAGVLDSARMSTFVAAELNVSVENVHSFVLGGHGDDMVPLARYSTVAGIPLPELIVQRQARSDHHPHPQRRRRNRKSAENRIGLLCALRRRRRNGRGDSEGQEKDSAVRRLSRRRIRNQRPLRRRACKARRKRRRADHRDQTRRPRKKPRSINPPRPCANW